MSDFKSKLDEVTYTKERQPGFCSATCVDRVNLQDEIKKPEPKTSDFFTTCNLPKRFEHPHWFNGYGCQVNKQHPFYRTSASEYGWYPPGDRRAGAYLGRWISMAIQRGNATSLLGTLPIEVGIHSVPSVFFPAGQTFTNRLAAAGMYRNYSLNTGMDPAGYQ